MACVWFTLLVILMTSQVFARDCSNLELIKNCDHCIQCGGVWCNAKSELRCSMKSDEFCPIGKEDTSLAINTVGTVDLWNPETGQPVHVNQSIIKVNSAVHNEFIITGPLSEEPKIAHPRYESSTITGFKPNFFNIKITSKKFDEQKNYRFEIEGAPGGDFCPAQGANYVETVTYKLDDEADARITYHVPCACGCSKTVEVRSQQCNGRGNFSCGICQCELGWKGDFCDEKDSRPNQEHCEDRGDVGGCENNHCSNNGYCECGKCHCRTDIPGYQYFDSDCADICTTAAYCDTCLTAPLGQCYDCVAPDMYIEAYNKTFMNRTDQEDRPIWIKCREKVDDCDIEYAARKDSDGIHVMIIDSCKVIQASQVGGPVNVTVPIILGVIALVAAATAVAGYMVWKNRGPPLPFADHDYGNIDAEDCTGENPLYKPPTSSFKNPTYGKW